MSTEEHTFKRFDQELTHLNSVVLRMGGLVVVFLVKGKDVRHVSPESIDTEELDR